MIFYFSGCGNSRHVAEQLAERLQQPLLFIPDQNPSADSYTFNAEEPLGFVFPVYSWAPPALVLQFVKTMQFSFSSSRPYTFMACTCGDDTGLTHKIFGKAMRERGLQLDAAFSLTMPETYINLPGFKLDTLEKERLKIAAAEEKIPLIASRIANRENVCDMAVGPLPWLKSHPIKHIFNGLIITDRPFKTTDACNGCELCSKICPLHNIQMENQRPTWQHHCANCMACYHHCPKNAIQYGSQTIGKGQYYFGKHSER